MANELKKLRQQLKRLRASSNKILLSSLSTLHADMVERIHTKGIKSNGQKIGQYSTNPISVASKNQPRQTGKTFFIGGYKEFKSAVGLTSNYVTLELTGQMRQDFGVIPINNKSAGLGFKNKSNADKSEWMEDKYGEIYQPTKKEKRKLLVVFDRQVDKILK